MALESPSGSGKTTLLSILGCILTASAGRVTVADETVDIGLEEATPLKLGQRVEVRIGGGE